MKLKQTFVIQTIAGSQIMVPVGESAQSFRGFVRNNETAAYIINQFKYENTRETVIEALMNEYEVDLDCAGKAVDYVIENLNHLNALEN